MTIEIETTTIRESWEKARENLKNMLFRKIKIPEKPLESDRKAWRKYQNALREQKQQEIQQRFALLASLFGFNFVFLFGSGRHPVISFGNNPEFMKKIFAWLLTGDPNHEDPLGEVSYAGGILDRLRHGGGSDEDAKEEGKGHVVFDRSSTHGVKHNKEVQGTKIGIENYLQGRSKDTDETIFESNSGARTLNYGLKFPFGGAGLITLVQEANGNCHMITMKEKSCPGEEGHGLGGQNETSLLGTQKKGDVCLPEEYFGEIPPKLNGVKMQCDTQEKCDELIKELSETKIDKDWFHEKTVFGFDGEELKPETICAWEAVEKLKHKWRKTLSDDDKKYLEELQKEIKESDKKCEDFYDISSRTQYQKLLMWRIENFSPKPELKLNVEPTLKAQVIATIQSAWESIKKHLWRSTPSDKQRLNDLKKYGNLNFKEIENIKESKKHNSMVVEKKESKKPKDLTKSFYL